MKLAIGCDEAAFSLKVEIIKHIESKGIEYKDFGANKGEVVLYPDVAFAVANAILEESFDRGILVCGTGIGMAISANKVKGIRAAVCHDMFSTQRSRKSNDAQIMCMGERVIGVELAKSLIDVWLESNFEGGGSTSKVERIIEYEQKKI